MAICSNMDGSRDHHIKGSPHLLNILFNILSNIPFIIPFSWLPQIKVLSISLLLSVFQLYKTDSNPCDTIVQPKKFFYPKDL